MSEEDLPKADLAVIGSGISTHGPWPTSFSAATRNRYDLPSVRFCIL